MSARQQKSYDQLCPLAMALDHVGDRWSLLVIRELLGGPARFNDLGRALPGIASNLLSNRLRRLEDSGIVERRIVFGSSAYAVTELGAGLRPVLEALGSWGMRIGPLPTSEPSPVRSARSAAMGLEAVLQHGQGPDEELIIDLLVDTEHLTVTIGGDRPATVRAGLPGRSHALIATTLNVLATLPLNGLPQGALSAARGDRSARLALERAIMTALDAMESLVDEGC
ncbi:MAG: helix-turn-helix transcriptional regulator [Acidimicrobiia bacterium]|nr:helix-turn-helix transcriptional regulator [Acidimicrobiia bacterium]